MWAIQGAQFRNNDLNQNSVSFMHMFNACLNCAASFKSLHQILLEGLQRQEQYCSVIWSKYLCHSRGHNSAIMTWIKTLFSLCICSMHVWNPCIKYLYCRRGCGDKNPTTKCDGRMYGWMDRRMKVHTMYIQTRVKLYAPSLVKNNFSSRWLHFF